MRRGRGWVSAAGSRAGILVLFLGALATLLPGLANAQSPQVQITSTVTDSWPSVQSTVTVLGADGQPVAGLPPEAFSAAIDGQGAPVTAVNTTSDPGLGIAVVMTFDTSGSMIGPPLEQAKAAGKALVAQLGPGDVGAVMAFSDSVTVVQQFTGDKAALNAAIDSLAAGGNTALYAGVQQSVALAQQAPVPRRAVVLLSDGVDSGGVSGVDPNSVLVLVDGSGVLFFSVGLGSGIDQGYLEQVARLGNGQLVIAPAPESLQGIYQSAGNVLRQQYVLTLDAASVQAADAVATLQVAVNAPAISASAETGVTLPPSAVVAAATPPPATPAATAAPLPSAESESSGGFPWLLIAVAGAIAVGVAALAAVVLRRRRRAEPASAMEASLDRVGRGAETALAYPEISRAVEAGETSAWLDGPGGERTYIGEAPMTVGFTADCNLVLPNGTGSNLERARIWRRDGRYMLHNLSRAAGLKVGGRPASWVVLEDGDEIEFGDSRLVFRDTEQSSAEI